VLAHDNEIKLLSMHLTDRIQHFHFSWVSPS